MYKKMTRENKDGTNSENQHTHSLSHNTENPIRQLHQNIGNQAVSKLVQSAKLQTKMTVGSSSDQYELEADRIAEEVLRMPEPISGKLHSDNRKLPKTTSISNHAIQKKENEAAIPTFDVTTSLSPSILFNNSFLLPYQNPRLFLIPPRLPSYQLFDPTNFIDWGSMNKPYHDRHVSYLVSGHGNAIQERWLQNYQLGLALGLNYQDSIWVSNKLTPFAIDAALINDFPTPFEKQDRILGIKTTIFNLPALQFKKMEHITRGTGEYSTSAGKLEQRINQEKGGGVPMKSSILSFMEDRFGVDFKGVRIHTNSRSAKLNQDLNARAFTTGKHIFFNQGQYNPEVNEGKRLLAHELSHVLQQDTGNEIRRKEEILTGSVESQIMEKLNEGRYGSALLQLKEYLKWEAYPAVKNWLAVHPFHRRLFLKHQLANNVAELYSAAELEVETPVKSFQIIDTWLQTEAEKQNLYENNVRLFDHMMKEISPYSGKNLLQEITKLEKKISNKEYKYDNKNPEFHKINLLAPSVEKKIEFYSKYSKLFSIVRKKFDPYSGISLTTFESLTDTNEVNREDALDIYKILKYLPAEQRNAFLESAAFAGALETDRDAEKYYKKNFRKQYKALPHNWDAAIWPWRWGSWDAPFAERLTINHAALMTSALNYEDKSTRKFGFDRGIDFSSDFANGKYQSDANLLLIALHNNMDKPDRLALLLAIAVRGGLEKRVTGGVLQPESEAGNINPIALHVIESYGFIAADNYRYHHDRAIPALHDNSQKWYITKKTLFGGSSGEALGDQRGTFDLRELQHTEDSRGSLGGMRFGTAVHEGDDYYLNSWLDNTVKGHQGSETLLPNLIETSGTSRRGKIFASIRNDTKQANIYAPSLPIEGLNYFDNGSLVRSGAGVIQGLQIHLSWTKEASDPNNTLNLKLDIANLELGNIQLIDELSTMAIGLIETENFQLKFSQKNLPAAKGLFWGMFKNADYVKFALLDLLPNVMVLLPYSVLAMIEKFQGSNEHTYKDALGDVLKSSFSSLQSMLSFTRLQVKNLYNTSGGFLDDFSIEKLDENQVPIRQGIELSETLFWTIDAEKDINDRIKAIDLTIREAKAHAVDSDIHNELLSLEKNYETKINLYISKGIEYKERSELKGQLMEISKERRELTAKLDKLFSQAVDSGMVSHELIQIKVLEKEKERLQDDIDYLNNDYLDDKQRAASKKGGQARFKAKRRKETFEAKYKSVDVDMALHGITLFGGDYIQDLINDSLVSIGLESPELKGIENIKIDSVRSAFTARGIGVSNKGTDPGVGIDKLKIPFITAPQLTFKTDSMLLKGGHPRFENVLASVRIDFPANPLDVDLETPYTYYLSELKVGKAFFQGLSLQIGKADPILDFPKTEPVEVWDLYLWDYDPEIGNINLKIRDIKAKGSYADKEPKSEDSKNISFGIDTTLDNDTKYGQNNALDLRYNKSEHSIDTQLNVVSAWLPDIDIQSADFSLTSLLNTQAVELKNLRANIKVNLKKDATTDSVERPTNIEIRNLNIGEINVQGLTFIMRDNQEKKDDEGEKQTTLIKTQEVRLPKDDKVSIKNLDVTGLNINLAEKETIISTLEDDSKIKLGETDLGGTRYSKKNARGSVLSALAIHKGKFDALTMKAIGRNGREYSVTEFFKFFGYTRLEGLDVNASFNNGNNRGTIGIRGEKNTPISVDYHEQEENRKAYYAIRLPLDKIRLPALHLEKDPHVIDIPYQKNRSYRSMLKDIDVKLRLYLSVGNDGKTDYDIYIDALDIATLKVFGLEYHNSDKGVDVVFDTTKALNIPNVKAGGFRYSSSKGFGVFGKKEGWLDAAVGESKIEANVASIKAEMENGSFLAESDGGRSAIGLDIESLGFRLDKSGNMKVTLGAIDGGFPKMTIKKKDPTKGVESTTVISTLDRKGVNADGIDITLGSDKNNVIDVQGLSAGGLKIISEEKKGSQVNTTTVDLGAESIGAKSAEVKLNADKSKEITFTDIYAGKIDVDLDLTDTKGTTKLQIDLPDPKLVNLPSLKVIIDTDENIHIIVERPTIRNFQLRIPSQTKPGDYLNVFCDAKVEGNVELGDGNFDSLTLADPKDAFVVIVPDDVPITLSNLRLSYRDTSASPAGIQSSSGLNADQKRLLQLEDNLDKERIKYDKIPAATGSGRGARVNPDKTKALAKLKAERKAYDDFRNKMIRDAKGRAGNSNTKKYLDAVNGTIKADLILFNTLLPLNIETHGSEKYVEITEGMVDSFKELLDSIIGSTVNLDFWSSEDMKNLGKGLKRWYTWGAPYTRGLIDAIADGNGIGAVLVFLENTEVTKGVLKDDASMFGLNFNINTSWAIDAFAPDEFSVGLCEQHYKHPTKDDFYNLYGFIEHLNYVSPALVSKAGQLDSARLKDLAQGKTLTEGQASDKDISEAVNEMILFIRFSLGQEVENIKHNILRNIKLASVDADISLTPQEVINTLLSEHKAGSLDFDKGSDTIDNLNIDGVYLNRNRVDPSAIVNVNTGNFGSGNIFIPGATYLSQTKSTKVSYDSLEISPLFLTYKDDVYKLLNQNIELKGLKVGIKKT